MILYQAWRFPVLSHTGQTQAFVSIAYLDSTNFELHLISSLAPCAVSFLTLIFLYPQQALIPEINGIAVPSVTVKVQTIHLHIHAAVGLCSTLFLIRYLKNFQMSHLNFKILIPLKVLINFPWWQLWNWGNCFDSCVDIVSVVTRRAQACMADVPHKWIKNFLIINKVMRKHQFFFTYQFFTVDYFPNNIILYFFSPQIKVSSRFPAQSAKISVCVQPPLAVTQDQFILDSLGTFSRLSLPFPSLFFWHFSDAYDVWPVSLNRRQAVKTSARFLKGNDCDWQPGLKALRGKKKI